MSDTLNYIELAAEIVSAIVEFANRRLGAGK